MKGFGRILAATILALSGLGMASAQSPIVQTKSFGPARTDVGTGTTVQSFNSFQSSGAPAGAMLDNVTLEVALNQTINNLSFTNSAGTNQSFFHSSSTLVTLAASAPTGCAAPCASFTTDSNNLAAGLPLASTLIYRVGAGHVDQVIGSGVTLTFITNGVSVVAPLVTNNNPFSFDSGVITAASVDPYKGSGAFTLAYSTSTTTVDTGTAGNFTITNDTTTAGTFTVKYFYHVPVSVTCPAITTATIGVPYSSSLTGSGGVAPYTYSLFSGSLPGTLNLIPATGAITGTPTAAGTITFVAKITDSSGPANLTANSATCNIVVSPPIPPSVPDMTITKTHTGNFTQGQIGATFTLGTSNVGNASTRGLVTVTDSLPAGLTATAISGSGWSCILASLFCSRSDVLQPGASYPPITLTVNVGPNVTGTLVNEGIVGGGGEVNLTNDTAYDSVTVVSIPDLTITKSHTGTTFQPGGTVTFTLVASNVGTGPTSGLVTVSDTLPAGLTATAISGGATFSCTLSTLSCTTTTVLTPAASYPPITVTARIATTATGTLVNNAQVGGGSEVNLTNDTATDSIVILIPDMTISKTHTGTSFTAGGSVTFTLTPSNVGMAPTIGTVTVTDTLPAGLTATAISGAGWSCVLSSLTCTTSATLAVNASYPPIALTASIAASATGTLVNNATVGGGGEVNLTNDSATDSIAVSSVPDLTITKTHTGTTFAPGGSVTFTLTPGNLGPGATSGTVTVTDTLPAGLTATAISGPSPWVCAAPPTLSCTRGDSLAANSNYSPITVTASIAQTALGTLVNNAQVGGGGETNLTNDTATDSITVAVPDLTITKTHTGTTFAPGGSVTFTLTPNNIGTAPTSGTVTVTDTLPAGLTATAIGGPTPWVCAALPALSCTRSDALAPGTSYSPITLTASIATNATGTLVNNALVGGGSEVNLTNDTATDSITVTGVPDMTITKSHTGTLTRGATGTYTIIASNVGGTPTTGAPVTVTDTLPTGLAATAIGGASPWSCTLSTLSCVANAALAPGAAFPPITITVVVAGNAPNSIVNTATVGGGGEVNLTNDTATDPALLSGNAPNLSITKTSSGTFLGGGTGSFTMVVSNNGTGPTSGVVTLSDPPLSFLTPTSVSGDGWTCVLSTVTCTRSDVLAPGASYPPVLLNVNIAANAPKNFTNVATTSGGGSPSTFSISGSSSVALTVVISNFTLTKTADHTQAQVGDVIGYTLQVTNSTTTPFPNAQVQDTPPAGFAYVPGSARISSGIGITQTITPVISSGILTFALGNVAPQQTIVITYRLQIGAKVRPGRNTNIAQAVAGPSASNPAQVVVTVDSGLFTTRQFLIGRVFEDSNGNGLFDPGERPVAGVRIYLSNGGSATTDSKGLYNIPTIAPGSVVVSIDPATLPKGYTNSSGGRLDAESWSRLVRTPLGEGMILRQNFALKPCPYCAPAPATASGPGAGPAVVSSRPAAKLEILPSQQSLPGDGRTSMTVRVRVLDDQGNPTRAKEIRIRTSAGQFVMEDDINSAANSSSPAGASTLFGKNTEPQTGRALEQVPQSMQAGVARSVNGEASFLMMAANTPGVAHLFAESGDPDHLLSATTDIWYTPEKRTAILVTDGEITVGRAAPEVPILGQGGEVTRRADVFTRIPLAADYLMTLGYTSHLNINDSNGNPGLFQTDPLNRVYQVYGDSSTQYQAAQSNAHAYGRIEHEQSYLMFGDLRMSDTPVNGAPTPASQAFHPQPGTPDTITYGVGDYNRNVVGAALHLEDSRHDFITLEGARPNTGFARDVFPGSTFGLIQLSHIDILPGSESGLIETRDVHNPEIVLSSEQLVRSVDYDINPYTGGIFFLRTLNAYDQSLNLVQVVFTYEYQSTTGVSAVYGIRTQARIDSWGLKLGLGITNQRDPVAGNYYLGDITLQQRMPYKGRLSVEVPVSHGSALSAGLTSGLSPNVNGVAVRADLDQPFPWLSGRFRGSFSKTDAEFFNPFGTTVIPGAQTSRGTVELSPIRKLRLKLGFTDERNRTGLVNNQRQTGSLEAKQSITETLVFTAGYDFRDFQNALTASEIQSNEVSAGLEWKPFSRFTASARREQNLTASDPTYPNETLLSAHYQASETVRLFATERLSSAPILPIGDLSTTGFSALAGKNETAIGIDDKWSKYTTLQSKYLVENGINGTDTFAVIGLINRLPVQEHLTLDLGLQRGELITGKDRSFDAGSIGFSWMPKKNFRASTRYEIRDLGGLGQIITTGVAGRIADGLTTLARFQYSDAAFQPGTGAVDVLNPLATNSTLSQQTRALQGTAALAWRPWKTDREGILFSYTLRDASLNGVDATLPQNDKVSMLSTDGYVQANRWLEFYGKFALSDRTYNYTGAAPLSTLTYLWQGRVQAKISRRFDVAGEARLVYQPDTNIHQWTAGVEGGFWVVKDLRAGLGYSFRSADEIAANFLTNPAKQGVYFVLTSKMSNMFNLFKTNECGCAVVTPPHVEPPKPVANIQISAITGGRDVCPGDNLQLRVSASGWLPDQTPVYQWYIDDQPVAGATGTTLAVPSANGSGSKSVKVSVTAGGITKMSDPATVVVKPTPPPTIQFTVSPSVINYGDKLPLAARAAASECTTPATIVYTASAGTVTGSTFDSTGVNLDMSNRARPQSTVVRLTATATDRIGQTAVAVADVTINLTPQAVRLDDLVFANNSDRVNNCGKRLLLEELTPMLRADPGARVILIGHRDTGERSTTIDRQRVLNAAAVLSAGKGICPQLDLSRILVKMAGTDQSSATRPVLCGSSTQERSGQAVSASDARAQFRRVEIWLVPSGAEVPAAITGLTSAPSPEITAKGCPR